LYIRINSTSRPGWPQPLGRETVETKAVGLIVSFNCRTFISSNTATEYQTIQVSTTSRAVHRCRDFTSLHPHRFIVSPDIKNSPAVTASTSTTSK